jgi:hypothetical protein
MTSNTKYWYGFRQLIPKPPGQAIACGPFDTYASAEKDRARSEAWDCTLSHVYSAASKDEAEELARKYISLP